MAVADDNSAEMGPRQASKGCAAEMLYLGALSNISRTPPWYTNRARSRGTCRAKARCSGRCAGCSCGRDNAARHGYRAHRWQAYSHTHAAACEDAE